MEVWMYYTFISVSILESLFAEKSQSKKKTGKSGASQDRYVLRECGTQLTYHLLILLPHTCRILRL